MTAKIVIAVLGVAVIVTVFYLVKFLPSEPCEHRAITFNWKDPSQPEKSEIYADPEELEKVQECASVSFVNLTKADIKIVFDKNTTGKPSPFAEVTTIELEPTGDPNEYAKAFSVTVKLTDDVNSMEFPYHVELNGVPQTEQSPRIRIGPRSVTDGR